MSSYSNLPDPNPNDMNAAEFDEVPDLDFESLFKDAVADIVQENVSHYEHRLGQAEMAETLQWALSVATKARRAPRKFHMRRLRQPNLDSLFLNLSPLQLEELQPDQSPPQPSNPIDSPRVPMVNHLMLSAQEPHPGGEANSETLALSMFRVSDLELPPLELSDQEFSELVSAEAGLPTEPHGQPPEQPLDLIAAQFPESTVANPDQINVHLELTVLEPSESSLPDSIPSFDFFPAQSEIYQPTAGIELNLPILEHAALNLPEIQEKDHDQPVVEKAATEPLGNSSWLSEPLPAEPLIAAELGADESTLPEPETPTVSEGEQSSTRDVIIPEDVIPEDVIAEDLIPEDVIPEDVIAEDLIPNTSSPEDFIPTALVAPPEERQSVVSDTPEPLPEPISEPIIQSQPIRPSLTAETSTPNYPFPNCPLEVTTQLEGIQSLIGELVTQDNCLVEQHQDIHVTLQDMLGDMISQNSQGGEVLANTLGHARQLKLRLQRSQKTLRQQRQTLQKLNSSCSTIQLLPLQNLFQPLVDWGNQLAFAQQQAHLKQAALTYQQPTSAGRGINFVLGGCNTMIDQRLFLRLRQPLTELFRHLLSQFFTDSDLDLPGASGVSAQTLQFDLWGYNWGQQIWIELRYPGNQLELISYIPRLSTQINALHGTVHLVQLPQGGTGLTLRLPRFFAITQVLLLKVEDQLLALPLNTLLQVVTINADMIFWQQGQAYYQLPQALVPIYPLKQCLQLVTESTFSSGENFPDKIALVCVGFGDHQVALQVDELLEEQELAVRPSTGFSKVQTPSYVCGYGLLNEDKLVPILDPAPLLERLETYTSACA
jgi:chemotaxis protein histidine kinase CheA